PQLLTAHVLAESALAEALAAEAIDISDEYDDPYRARNRIDVRKWYAARIKPSKIGDRLDVNVTQIVDISAALSEARSRLQPVRNPRVIAPSNNHDKSMPYSDRATGSQPVNLLQGLDSIDPFSNSEDTSEDNSEDDIF